MADNIRRHTYCTEGTFMVVCVLFICVLNLWGQARTYKIDFCKGKTLDTKDISKKKEASLSTIWSGMISGTV